MCTGNRFSFGPQCTLLCKTQNKRSPRTGLRQTESTTNLYRLRSLLAFASVTELWTKRNNQELPRNSISCLPTVCAGLSPCKIIKYTLVSYLVLGLELLPQGRLEKLKFLFPETNHRNSSRNSNFPSSLSLS